MEDKVMHRVRCELANFRTQNPSPSRFHPYSQDGHTQPSYNHSFCSRYPEQDKTQLIGKCFICGDTSCLHISHNCIATTLSNGKPCHLRQASPSKHRKDKNNRQYCFTWNRFTGCRPGSRCSHGEHLCSLCRSSSHNVQHCTTV